MKFQDPFMRGSKDAGCVKSVTKGHCAYSYIILTLQFQMSIDKTALKHLMVELNNNKRLQSFLNVCTFYQNALPRPNHFLININKSNI